jgi:phenylalanyl-tRNA synthetase beta chain
MLDLGRPAHAYDLKELKGGVSARRARDGERVLALNEKDYVLDGEMTVIADEAQVHDIGGIMGGEHSRVATTTTDALLEIAYFDPERIARTGQKLQITSDARSRFERGVDPAFLDDGLAILTGLILDICGGEASRVVRAGEPPVPDKRVKFDPARTLSLGGLDVPVKRQAAILESLGFTVANGEAKVPSWRRDIDGPADLVEEVARIAGFDLIPSTALPRDAGVARPTATRAQASERHLRRMAAARGLDEAVTWSFVSREEADQFGGAADVVANPISAEMSHMRPSLLPGLIAAARRNLDRGAASVRLFEIGRRYLEEGERRTAGLILSGDSNPRSWILGKPREFTAFDAKAEALALLEAAGAPVRNLQLFMDAGTTWHPGRSARLGLGPKTVLAVFGELHPSIARGLPRTVAAELYLDAIPESRSSGHARAAYTPPALQSVTRDFAFVVPGKLAADSLVRAIRGADKQAITAARVFDRYRPGDGELSLAIEVVLQPDEHSFTEAEIAEIAKRVIAAAEKLGARLRT